MFLRVILALGDPRLPCVCRVSQVSRGVTCRQLLFSQQKPQMPQLLSQLLPEGPKCGVAASWLRLHGVRDGCSRRGLHGGRMGLAGDLQDKEASTSFPKVVKEEAQ